ncbi:hypothetical protein [Parasphingorhabdus sp.]|uniref:hypothetical protein n=1 Tax=Parasphingorhabdus sp. TaxID=2709688 RepID=UPI0030A3B0A1
MSTSRILAKGGVTRATLKVLGTGLGKAGKKPVDKRAATGLFSSDTIWSHLALS